MVSINLAGYSFSDELFSNYNYLNLVTVDGVQYPAWQAMWVAGLKNIGALIQSTSASSVAIGTGAKTFVLATDVPFVQDQFVFISNTSTAGEWMYGQVTSYNSSTKTLIVNVTDASGSGTETTWKITASGPKGTLNVVTSTRTSNSALVDADKGSVILATSAFTQTITAKANLSQNWIVFIKNASTGNLIIDPNSSETIEGQTTITLLPGDSCYIHYDGTNLRTLHFFTQYGYLSGDVPDPQNGDYVVNLIMPFAGSIDQTQVKTVSGTCTVAVKINDVALGGGSNSASTTLNTVSHSSANTFAAGDKISFTVSSFSSAVTLAYNIRFKRNL